MAVLFSADNCLVGCVGGSLQNCVCWCRRIYQPDILHARSSAAHHVGAVVCAFISGHSTKAGHRLGVSHRHSRWIWKYRLLSRVGDRRLGVDCCSGYRALSNRDRHPGYHGSSRAPGQAANTWIRACTHCYLSSKHLGDQCRLSQPGYGSQSLHWYSGA